MAVVNFSFLSKPQAWILFFVLFSHCTMAEITQDLKDSNVIATIDHTTVPAKSFDLLYAVASQGKGALSREALLESLIESRLLSLHGEAKFGKAYLMQTTNVGYPAETSLEDDYTGILRFSFQQDFNRYLESRYQGKLENMVIFSSGWQGHLPEKASKLLLDASLSETDREKFKSIVVAKATSPKNESYSLSLLDIYNAQNVQGKIAIQNRDVAFIEMQAVVILAKKYFLDWIIKNNHIDQESLDGLKLLAWDRLVKQKMLHEYGLNNDAHDENPALTKAMKAVTTEEIKRYYSKHREKFKRIESVTARHIRLAEEGEARKVFELLNKGLSFDEAVATYSIAEDKSAKIAGSLGTIKAEDEKDWLHTVIFALPEKKISRPFRTPQTGDAPVYWEIFYVDQKQWGYHAVDSETVRYNVGLVIALNHLKNNFKVLRQQLFDSADIRVNASLLVSK